MNRNHSAPATDHGATLAVDERPRSLHVAPGSALFALHGEVWLTQEGHREDTILAAGARHDVPDRGTLVVSATGRAAALLYVAEPAVAAAIEGTDLHGHLRRRAHAARRQEIDRLSHSAWQSLAHSARRLAQALRRLVTREVRAVPNGRHGAAH